MPGQPGELARLRAFLAGQPALELAILVGSRTDGRARKGSDWDIAIQWPAALSLFDTLARSETLHRDLAAMLGAAEEQIDLIDLPTARLEQNGVLHALQVLIENAIGKSKQMLKAAGEPVPVSAYDAFAALARRGGIRADELPAWNAVIGLRKRIVHDYMNIDMARVLELVQLVRHEFVTAFLLADPVVG